MKTWKWCLLFFSLFGFAIYVDYSCDTTSMVYQYFIPTLTINNKCDATINLKFTDNNLEHNFEINGGETYKISTDAIVSSMELNIEKCGFWNQVLSALDHTILGNQYFE